MTNQTIVRPEPDRDRTIAGLLDEYRSFAELIGAVEASDWTRQTRCAGWQVRDVAGHVVGQAMDTVSGVIGSRTPDEQAAALRGQSPTALAAQLHTAVESITRLATVIDDAAWSAPSSVAGLTLGQGIHALLHDAYVHGDDIRAALGLPSDVGPSMYASADFLLGALLRDAAAAAAVGQLLVLPADQFEEQTGIAVHDFVLAATGRSDPGRLWLPDIVNIYR